MNNYKLSGNECLGIEFGSTRIKAILIDENFNVLATGSHDWENKLIDGYWTYGIDDIWSGLQDAYKSLNNECIKKFSSKITSLASIGFSAMMHGYLPFDKDDNLLTPFRTWRNTTTSQAAQILTDLFNFNIPQRWSIAHLYQAILNNEQHVKNISYITTLAGYVHYKLSGKKVVGIGEASGMFPIDSNSNDYNGKMLDKFSNLENVKEFDWNIRDILPKVLLAGDNGGVLSENGAKLLDPSGVLKAGALMCPPEGDAGTGMVATNSIAQKSGNISAGTSIFSMIVLEKQLSKVYEEIDMVTTPTGKPVAMVHCNNCCTDLDYWVKLFIEFSTISGSKLTKGEIYDLLYNEALKGEFDCGGIVSSNYFSGEPVTKFSRGIPMLLRSENSRFNLANFMRNHIYSAIATLKIGLEILENENVKIDKLMGHGGLFKTKYVGQKLMAGAMKTPVSVLSTAGEGGAWGIAVLASFAKNNYGLSLESFLDEKVFSRFEISTVEPDINDVKGFEKYMTLYKKSLAVEKAAVENI
ncbi:MAG: FGGY-family carbohydrate kinase [Eubacteriales bacterium]|nr:FGGY-family carbohydrate kinase [Eubacteriales bacterium]